MKESSAPAAVAALSSPLILRYEQWLDGLPGPKLLFWFQCLYAPSAWLMLLILPTRPPNVTLDFSWMAVLNYAAAHDWQHGVDLSFTYGPLGYLNCTAQYASGFFLSGIVYQLVFKAFYVGVLCRLSVRLPREEAVVFLVLNAVLPMVDDDSIHLLTISYTGLLLCGRLTGDRAWGLGGVIFVALATLIKGSLAIYGGFMLVCVCAYLLLNRRWLMALFISGLFLASYLAADSWMAGQSLKDLPAYFRSSLAMISGYSPAMSIPVPWSALLGVLVFYGLIWLRLTQLALRSSAEPCQRWALFFLVNAGLFLAWKAGMTRGDTYHQSTFFLYAVALGSAGSAFFPEPVTPSLQSTSSSLQILWALAPAFVIWAMCVQIWSGTHYPPQSRLAANLRWLLTPTKQHARLEQMAQLSAEESALPRCQAIIGRATTDLFGTEQGIVLANGLNYRPAPIFQAYCAYTPLLIHANTALYSSERAPQFVLFKPATIDNRFPTLDNAGVLLELLYHYRPLLMERGCLLLQRRLPQSPPVDPTAKPLASGELRPGDKLTLPKAAGAIWCEIDIRPNLPSKLAGLVYQSSPYELEVFKPGAAAPDEYRIVPGMTSAGFLLTPAVALMQDFLRLQAGQPDESQRAEAIAVKGGATSSPVRYRLYELPSFVSPADIASEQELLRASLEPDSTPVQAARRTLSCGRE